LASCCWNAAQTRDIPVVQGLLLVVSCLRGGGQPGVINTLLALALPHQADGVGT
jgi:hypothetical protein